MLVIFLGSASPGARTWSGVAEGMVTVNVTSVQKPGEKGVTVSNIELPVRVSIVPTPQRHVRLLWDQFHNINYPTGYGDRDSIVNQSLMWCEINFATSTIVTGYGENIWMLIPNLYE